MLGPENASAPWFTPGTQRKPKIVTENRKLLQPTIFLHFDLHRPLIYSSLVPLGSKTIWRVLLQLSSTCQLPNILYIQCAGPASLDIITVLLHQDSCRLASLSELYLFIVRCTQFQEIPCKLTCNSFQVSESQRIPSCQGEITSNYKKKRVLPIFLCPPTPSILSLPSHRLSGLFLT